MRFRALPIFVVVALTDKIPCQFDFLLAFYSLTVTLVLGGIVVKSSAIKVSITVIPNNQIIRLTEITTRRRTRTSRDIFGAAFAVR